MMDWILFIIVTVYSTGGYDMSVHTNTIEFRTEEMCMEAQKTIKSVQGEYRSSPIRMKEINTFCVKRK
jgi:hypothetical protein